MRKIRDDSNFDGSHWSLTEFAFPSSSNRFHHELGGVRIFTPGWRESASYARLTAPPIPTISSKSNLTVGSFKIWKGWGVYELVRCSPLRNAYWRANCILRGRAWSCRLFVREVSTNKYVDVSQQGVNVGRTLDRMLLTKICYRCIFLSKTAV